MVDDPVREKANHVRAQLRALASRLQAGDDSQLVVWVIPGKLGVAHRPLRFHPFFGGSGQSLPTEATPEVICWVKRIVDQGFRAIICLMHPKEVAHYAKLDLGAADLLALYRAKGLEVCHLPWDDPAHRPLHERAVFSDELARIRVQALECFDKLPKPVLLHCSAGIDRSSPLCAYIHQRRGTDAA
ncbi:MAG: hypothetical protein ACRD2A_06210 [Vicinamibacterales bacterium]